MKSQRNSFAKVFYRRLKDPQEVEKTFFISLFNVKIEHLTLNTRKRDIKISSEADTHN